ncbi:MAG: adenylyl-sulfate kinase [Firmicutes bacterium]|nr:adenylyl-sulfate kinase [Bacillota bacterium]MBQ9604795.1 adenylyl-sulfate kinase [Bacillota bacterium]
MPKGKVCRITGLSNSGKTTIGTALYYEPKKTSDNVVILDGVYYF